MKKLTLSLTFLYSTLIVFAQVGIGTASPSNSAQLELKSTTRGFLPPRMTTGERDAIATPAAGLQVFNTSTNCLEFYVNGLWQTIACGCVAAPSSSPNAATHIATGNQVVWNWNIVGSATGYKYNTINNWATATDNLVSTSYVQSGLSCDGNAETLYVWAYNACGQSSPAVLNASLVFPVMVNKTGTGSGTISSTPTGINCSTDCNEDFTCGTQLILTATADAGSGFAGWSGGGCSGTGTCNTTVNNAQNITANFTLNTYQLSVSKSGTGNGTVTSSPAGINCGADCSETYNHGTMVTLTAAAAAGSTFTGWSGGGCSGTGTCIVTMDNAKNVTANFTLNTYTLTISKTGAGSGTVTSSPAGINCGIDCNEVYNHGTSVTLTATPASGSTFTGWSGADNASGASCVVILTSARMVTAIFQ